MRHIHIHGRIARISVWGPQVDQGVKGTERGGVSGGVSPSPLRVGFWSPENVLNFHIKMVSFYAFRVAISYRFAACFTGIGSTCGIESYWRSFQHFGNYNYRPPPAGKLREKMTKMRQKTKNCRELRWFLHISPIYSLEIVEGVDWGHGPQ